MKFLLDAQLPKKLSLEINRFVELTHQNIIVHG